jgi:uncharacterized membrane protein
LWPWAAITADWLHLLAVGFWAGGLVALVLTLPPALRPYQGEQRREALLAVLSRFSRLAVLSVGVVIATGIYSTFNWLNAPSDLAQTTYGGALIAKIVLAGALLLFGLSHYAALHPAHFLRWSAVIERTRLFTGSLRLEALLVLPVMAAAALLSATPVPAPEVVSVEAPKATQMVGGWNVTMTITPGGPGINTFDIQLTDSRTGQAVSPPDVRVQIVHPALDKRTPWQAAEAAGDGLYVSAGDEIDRPGAWWTLVDITDCPGESECNRTRVAFDWEISRDAAVIQSREPGVLNLLAIGGILLAVGQVIYSPARRFYTRLDLSPASVTVAVSATVITLLFVIVGVVMIQNTQAQYEAALNPIPRVVNTVLPDTDSLQRGRALYESDCAAWKTYPEDVNALADRLPRTRDAELFEATRDGWRGLPPCENAMNDEQRWDIVNYFRTFEEGNYE